MRTKTLLLSAAVGAAGLVAASAQTVYSVNSVGYVNLPVVQGFNMIGNPLDAGTDDLNDILPTVPADSTIYFFRNGGWTVSAQYFDGFGWFAEPTLPTWPAGEGAMLQSTAASTLTFVGEVRQGELNTPVAEGISLLTSQVPQAATLDDLGVPGSDGDLAYTWNAAGQGYDAAGEYFDGVGWFADPQPLIAVAAGFLVDSDIATTWTRNFSVNN